MDLKKALAAEHDEEHESNLATLAANLTPIEVKWRDRQPFLEAKGYMLRPRYRPGWVPSWKGSDLQALTAEDAMLLPFRPSLIDATRISDGQLVYLKRVKAGENEIKIATLFSTEALRDDPENHCVPILDTFQDDSDPSFAYIVMPFLRLMDDPPFEYVNDVVDLTDQLLQGLVFMHRHHVAHRDCALKNLMMEASTLYPAGFHPVQTDFLPDGDTHAEPTSRLLAHVKYYYVDFGIALCIPPDVNPKIALGRDGLDREVPELSDTIPYDPFKVDIFILGNVFRKEIYAKFSNVGFMRPLVKSMTCNDPEQRPDAVTALQQWRQIRGGIFLFHRGWRLRKRSENVAQVMVFDVVHFMKLGILLSSRFIVWTSRLLALLQRIV